MGKTTFRTFATFTVLLLVLATVFALTFGLFDAHIFAPLDVASAASIDASESADYYAPVEGLSTNGSAFRSSLAALIKHDVSRQSSYSGLINVFPDSDANPNNKSQMLWFYTGTVAKSGTNREHVWPKDGGRAFPEKNDAGSDAHHLRPTDQQLNSTRGSLSFGEVSQVVGNIVKEYGSTTYSNLCYKSSQFFYPGVGYRGATARILMYVQTRWGDQYNLQFVLGAGHSKTIGDIETLMKWHLEEPVTEAERLRNDEVYKLQGNRNPFIDHPEYAERIFCYDGESYNTKLQAVVAQYGASEPIKSLSFKDEEISLSAGSTSTLSVTYNPSNAKREVNWASSDPSVATVDATGKVTAIANGTTTITVSSKENPSIKASVKVNVKSVSSISLSGNPAKTQYNEGETFAPSGLTVKAIFSDNTSAEINTDDCQWLDAVTGQKSLSKGTTAVTCKYVANGKTFTATYSGITVTKVEGAGKTTIDFAATSAGSSYSWCNWSADGISGKIYMYKGANNTIQMNTNGNRVCYLYNSTALPGNIVSITITLAQDASGKDFEVRTSSTPFSEGTSFPTTGNVAGTLTANTNGVTLKVNSSDRYFAISYKGSGVVYIKSIDILYGQAATECDHTYGDWTVTKEATATENGEKTRTCTKCGHVETQVIPATGGTTECDHSYGDWTITKEATTESTGTQTRTCTKCGHTETQVIPKVTCSHTYSDWTITKEAIATENGEKTRTCTKCGHVETQVIPATGGTTGGEYTAEDFVNAVNAIDSAATDEEKAALIAYAESIYNSLNESQTMQIESQNAFLDLCAKKDKLQQRLNQLAEGFKLSAGEIAGIVVGCVAFVAIVAVVVVVLINNGKKNKMSRN